MAVVIEFFSTLGKAIVGAFEFFVDMIQDLVFMVKLLAEILPAAPAFMTWLPAGLAYMIALTLSVVVIFRILGRGD